MSNTNNMDARAGAFCDIKVNCNWWSERITECAKEYSLVYGDSRTLEDYVFTNNNEEKFWYEWNDKLHSYLTKVIMGNMEKSDIDNDFYELVEEYIGNHDIILEYEDEEIDEEEDNYYVVYNERYVYDDNNERSGFYTEERYTFREKTKAIVKYEELVSLIKNSKLLPFDYCVRMDFVDNEEVMIENIKCEEILNKQKKFKVVKKLEN